MIKVCELITRRKDLPLADFRNYWLTVHGPIVARIPGLVAYSQTHPLLGGYKKGALAFDGVAEIWVKDKSVLRGLAQTPEFHAAKADEANFIETEELIELVVDEHPLWDKPLGAEPIKSISFIEFQAQVTPQDAQHHWRTAHAQYVIQIPGLRRYVQNHVRLGAYRNGVRPPLDGLAITYFDDVDSMRVAASSDAYRQTRADEVHFLKTDRRPTMLGREHVIVG